MLQACRHAFTKYSTYARKLSVCVDSSTLTDSSGAYYWFQMALHSRALEVVSRAEDVGSENSGTTTVAWERDLRYKALQYALSAAELLRNYRTRYGLKIAVSFLIQPAAIAINLLLRSMQQKWDQDFLRSSRPWEVAHLTDDVNSAFEECFRCLLAFGMQQMLPRAIARMVYHNAKQFKVGLPELVDSTLHAFSHSNWRRSEVRMLNSMYPNYAKTDDTVEEMLRQWDEVPNDEGPLGA